MENLTDAYENGKYIAGAAKFPPKWNARANAFREAAVKRGKAELDLSYGRHDRHRLDMFFPDQAPKGLAVFVHGGYWKAFDKSTWSHLAAGPLAHGFSVAVPSYVLAPDARISEITVAVQQAIDFAAQMIAGPIVLTGHSAGGHLVSRMLERSWVWQACVAERLQNVVSISGLHDLRPLLQTDMNADLRLDTAEAAKESAVLIDNPLPVPVTAWVGGAERPSFLDQSQWLSEAWENASLHIDENRHHFDVVEALEDPSSPLTKCLAGP